MKKQKLTKLERTIRAREHAIQRLREKKQDIRLAAEDECAAIDKKIAARMVLLEALKSGALQP